MIFTRRDSLSISRIVMAVTIGILIGLLFAFLSPIGFFVSDPLVIHHGESNLQVKSSECDSTDRINKLKVEIMALKSKIRELDDQPKSGPFGSVKALRTNPTVLPDESVNPRLAKILEKVAVKKELIVALANSNVKPILQVWFTSIKKVGISNYLVVALDDEIERYCVLNNVPVYKRDANEFIDSIGKTGGNHAVSGLKFRVLREFLELGYSVLLSDIDIVYLQNPFDYLFRDSDIESMSDGHDNMTAYGYDEVFDEPSMGWARYALTMRIWVYNSGFFYIRPTIPAIELLDRVAVRLSEESNSWDQTVFNEELFFPSDPGYEGLHIAKRTMDLYMFMNSKVLFRTVRKDEKLRKLKPVIVHLNYHPEKLERMNAVVEYYVDGKKDALDSFPDGSM